MAFQIHFLLSADKQSEKMHLPYRNLVFHHCAFSVTVTLFLGWKQHLRQTCVCCFSSYLNWTTSKFLVLAKFTPSRSNNTHSVGVLHNGCLESAVERLRGRTTSSGSWKVNPVKRYHFPPLQLFIKKGTWHSRRAASSEPNSRKESRLAFLNKACLISFSHGSKPATVAITKCQKLRHHQKYFIPSQ